MGKAGLSACNDDWSHSVPHYQIASIDKLAVESLFLEAQTKDATYARANGIIHDIREIQIPTGASVLQLIFQR